MSRLQYLNALIAATALGLAACGGTDTPAPARARLSAPTTTACCGLHGT
jgi:hypothetical protein